RGGGTGEGRPERLLRPPRRQGVTTRHTPRSRTRFGNARPRISGSRPLPRLPGSCPAGVTLAKQSLAPSRSQAELGNEETPAMPALSYAHGPSAVPLL